MPESPPMMTCGHAANSVGRRPGEIEGHPACAICSCFDIDPDPPSLVGRTARCTYYGKAVPNLRNRGSCATRASARGTDAERTCWCERPSTEPLWFFKHHPDKDYDEFYCACWGDD